MRSDAAKAHHWYGVAAKICEFSCTLETELSSALTRAEKAEGERAQWEKDCKLVRDRYESFIVWVSSAAFKALGKYRDGHVCDYRNAVQSIADKVKRHTWAQEEVSELDSLRTERDDLQRQLAEAKAEGGPFLQRQREDMALIESLRDQLSAALAAKEEAERNSRQK